MEITLTKNAKNGYNVLSSGVEIGSVSQVPYGSRYWIMMYREEFDSVSETKTISRATRKETLSRFLERFGADHVPCGTCGMILWKGDNHSHCFHCRDEMARKEFDSIAAEIGSLDANGVLMFHGRSTEHGYCFTLPSGLPCFYGSEGYEEARKMHLDTLRAIAAGNCALCFTRPISHEYYCDHCDENDMVTETESSALDAHRKTCPHGDSVCYWTCAECRRLIDELWSDAPAFSVETENGEIETVSQEEFDAICNAPAEPNGLPTETFSVQGKSFYSESCTMSDGTEGTELRTELGSFVAYVWWNKEENGSVLWETTAGTFDIRKPRVFSSRRHAERFSAKWWNSLSGKIFRPCDLREPHVPHGVAHFDTLLCKVFSAENPGYYDFPALPMFSECDTCSQCGKQHHYSETHYVRHFGTVCRKCSPRVSGDQFYQTCGY